MISNSWDLGPPVSQGADDAVDFAVTYGRAGKGAVVLAATGNQDIRYIPWPAIKPNVIAVGASSMCDERKHGKVTFPLVSCDGEIDWGSNYGSELDVVAPGVKMPTTDLTGTAGYNQTTTNGDYNLEYRGTSAATPMAAGVAALIISVNRCFMGSEVRDILEKTANKKGNYNYAPTAGHHSDWHEEMGYGVVNAYDAVQEAINRGARTCPEPMACLSLPPDESRKTGSVLTKQSVEPFIVSYPNPFGQNITFSYKLPDKAIVSLAVKDALGRNIAIIHDKVEQKIIHDKVEQKAGLHEVTYTNSNLPSGMYFYTFTVGNKTRTYKLLKVE